MHLEAGGEAEQTGNMSERCPPWFRSRWRGGGRVQRERMKEKQEKCDTERVEFTKPKREKGKVLACRQSPGIHVSTGSPPPTTPRLPRRALPNQPLPPSPPQPCSTPLPSTPPSPSTVPVYYTVIAQPSQVSREEEGPKEKEGEAGEGGHVGMGAHAVGRSCSTGLWQCDCSPTRLAWRCHGLSCECEPFDWVQVVCVRVWGALTVERRRA